MPHRGTPPTTVVTTWACWATVTVPDLCTVMMGRVDVLAAEETEVPTWAAAVFSMRVAGLLTWRSQRRVVGGWGEELAPAHLCMSTKLSFVHLSFSETKEVTGPQVWLQGCHTPMAASLFPNPHRAPTTDLHPLWLVQRPEAVTTV